MTGNVKSYKKPEWPEHAANVIKEVAGIVGHNDAVKAVVKVQDEIYGDIPRIVTLARHWGDKKSSSDTKALKMADLATHLSLQSGNLGNYWTGNAYTAYKSYATSIVGILGTDGKVMDQFATSLGICADIVFNTYSKALSTIANVGAGLLGMNVTNVLFGLTWEIPGVDLVTGGVAVAKIIDTLEDFVKQIGDLIAAAIKLCGEAAKAGIDFSTSAGQFTAP